MTIIKGQIKHSMMSRTHPAFTSMHSNSHTCTHCPALALRTHLHVQSLTRTPDSLALTFPTVALVSLAVDSPHSQSHTEINLINVFLARGDVILELDTRPGRCRLMLMGTSVEDARAGMSRLRIDLYLLYSTRCIMAHAVKGIVNPA
jgi:hypothetical protein